MESTVSSIMLVPRLQKLIEITIQGIIKINIYTFQVGGELSSTIISHMNDFGRIAVCGSISTYNEISDEKRKGIFEFEFCIYQVHFSQTTYYFSATIIQPFIVSKQLKMEGFLVNRFADRTFEGIQQNLQWVKEGKLKYREHIWDGFDKAVDAFIGMFKGENIGKSIVRV